ncbi:type I polyketide synthase [Mycobacterium ulcerans]|nr:type I polyketide synthase [Mycobacterium ulcerans]MEB3905137.1 type I polyketide synthase [Mycobacterium ulcerans]MEB3909342.1 type I polyketide synthase [Mycobacterium ulcerans]MEB3919579.1 type I polyketide synthase [Mycobacterium ulcerans]MEB3923649.1 type I polyketide synthase [Mycobacterium ulcerans]MEB3927849.1 type I polyketide synthase [Mycobacterium ulcerans]
MSRATSLRRQHGDGDQEFASAVAIIGVACRIPGAANPGEFWELVSEGHEVAKPIDHVGDFDAEFFNVSPREATAMDPRQRLALELAWELFEDARIVAESVRGEPIAVYLGAMNDDYALLTLDQAPDKLDHYSFAGASRGMIANRVSSGFALHGPSMTVDCGQSSSLVAVHLAPGYLRGAGDATMAIAGGIHLNLASETGRLETEFGAVSASGRTYAFDARADGYVRSEGGGLVLLKPLRAALEDGNSIRAVILGEAVGSAGHTAGGLAAPSAAAEADVMRRAMASAGVDPNQIDYIEAHGTGTRIGDTTEAQALSEVFATRETPVWLGSVKSNIGHTGAAAGAAGLIKTVLSLENGAIPASLNFVGDSAGTDMESHGLHVSTTLTPWPRGAGPRRAGVSSFGMGGTNAHVIVQQAPIPQEAVADPDGTEATVPWLVSARSRAALAGQAQRLAAWVAELPSIDVADVGWSLLSTRSVFEHRAVLVGGDRGGFMAGLAALASGEPGVNLVAGRAGSGGKTVLVFPGQGAQWLGMGRDLYGRFPAFAKAFDTVADALDEHLRLPLREVIWGADASLLEGTEFAQPALFALEVALAALLQACGVVADLVMGHSVGEISAAHVAGVLSLTDAARLVSARGRLMAQLPPGGVMVAVAASAAQVAPMLQEGVSIAAVNGPDSVVISGPEAATAVVADRLTGQGCRAHRLAVSHAFHSALMEPMMVQFGATISGIVAHEPRIALVSNMTGQLAAAGYGTASYWVEHVRKPVRFADGVALAESLGAATFLETGPSAGLGTSVALLAKGRPEVESLLTAMGQLYVDGADLDWRAAFAGLRARTVTLPTYSFARQRFWLGEGAGRKADSSDESGLRPRLDSVDSKERFRQLVDLVCLHAAIATGHSNSHQIDAERAFQGLGFESMTGVELRNRLRAVTGLALSRTIIFDYTTPMALARHLDEQLSGGNHEESDDDKIWSVLRTIPVRELRRSGMLDKLLLLAGQDERPAPDAAVSDDVIDSLSPEALVAMALDSEDDDPD